MTDKKLIFIGAAGATALLIGCASDPDRLFALQESPSYHFGYGDGCTSSTEADKSFSTKVERDVYAFENDDAYRFGWRQGYLECASRVPDANDGGRITGERDERF